ncbi:PAS domain S-box protein [Natrinema sp. 1APR25-10V2]|uniref:PAS domain S-box protein n=1 Tax=Natrinema sp. 1APR25-10V2 TaxID=2951081 RepID=UPI00287461CD|nr:PAS domain S-box protein [Natrinema sp. 1APR25-10V2]MDS0477965.1 PAS domain S-box protein [Natrinema sp. 1APR25-10V2]
MVRGLEESEAMPVSALAVGSSEWIRTATAGLADGSATVLEPVSTAAELTAERLDAADCVLTDDRDVLAAVEGACPIVYAVDPAADESIDRLRSDGADDVIAKTTIQEPPLLAHRLRQTVRCASVQPATDRDAEWYRTLIEQSSDLLVVIDDTGEITYVSPAVERVGGFDRDELCGSNILDYVHPDDEETVTGEFDAVQSGGLGTTRTVEYTCQHGDGSWYVHKAALTNRLDDGLVDGVIASIRDITEYHRIEQELTESFKRVTDAFYALDRDWRFTYVNDRALEHLDVERSELLGQHILDFFPEMKGTKFQSKAIKAMEEQEPQTVEAYFESYDVWIEARIYPSPSGISVYWRDVTDRIEREQNLAERTERLQTLVENVPIVMFVLDEDGTVTLLEGRGLQNLGVDSTDAVGTSFFDILDDYPEVCANARAALDGAQVHSQSYIGDHVFETWYRPIVDDGEVDRVIGVASDITERVQYQEALNALHEATSHLLSVESKQAACEYIVDVATDVLDLDSVVYRFDDRNNELEPAAHSPALESTFGSPPRLGPNDSIAWETFVTGDAAVFDDIRTKDAVYDEATAARSGLYVPLGEHGVLVALSTDAGRYDTDTVELAQLFATAAEAALDRIGRTRRLHDRERELKQQNRHLERLNDANEVRQEIEQLLLMADSRAEIERGVPELLADLEACSLAWIGEPDPSGNQLQPRSHAGLDRGYLDAVTVTTVDESAAEPTGRAARTRTPVSVENIAESVHDGEWRGTALSRNLQSVYAVPLVYDGFLYGVLSIYGEERNAFDETLRSTLSELGETIAYAIDAVKRKNALVGDNRTEVELEVPADATLCRLAAHLGEPVTYEGATTRADGSQIVFAAVEGPVDDVAGTVDHTTIEGISELSTIAEHEGETLLQLRLSEPFLGSIVDTHGALLREFVADEADGRAIIDVPDAVEIREVLSGINRTGPSVSMVARREQATADRSMLGGPARNALLETFTDRQREVVQTAYHGGFFEWPRQATGEEIADSLSISSPAFHKHVRSAERKLFAALFEGSAAAEVN